MGREACTPDLLFAGIKHCDRSSVMEKLMEYTEFIRNSFLTYSGHNKIWLLYPFALLVILLRGKKSDRLLFGGMLILQLLTFCNPGFAYLINKLFHYETRYLRLFWTVPFFLTIGYGAILFAGVFQQKRLQTAVLLAVCACICVLGTPVFYGNGVPEYTAAAGHQFISPEVIALSEIFHQEGTERPKVMYGYMMLSYRQFDPSVISLFTKKILQSQETQSREEFIANFTGRKRLRNLALVYFYQDYSISPKKFFRYLRKENVNYIVSNSDELDAYLQRGPVSLLGQVNAYRVWKIS